MLATWPTHGRSPPLTQVDSIFLAADTNTARHVTNAVIQQDLVPGIQVGVCVPVATDGQIGEVHVAIRPLLPGVACQWCQELIDPPELALEAQGRGRPGRCARTSPRTRERDRQGAASRTRCRWCSPAPSSVFALGDARHVLPSADQYRG
jgi:hypothetical protein